MSFTNGKPFAVTSSIINIRRKYRRPLCCPLCGHAFEMGDIARFIFGKDCVNFFVCSSCDEGDEKTVEKAQKSYQDTLKNARNWSLIPNE